MSVRRGCVLAVLDEAVQMTLMSSLQVAAFSYSVTILLNCASSSYFNHSLAGFILTDESISQFIFKRGVAVLDSGGGFVYFSYILCILLYIVVVLLGAHPLGLL